VCLPARTERYVRAGRQAKPAFGRFFKIIGYRLDTLDPSSLEYNHRQRHGTDGLTQQAIQEIIDIWIGEWQKRQPQ
jgi:hypothetical protein